MELAKNFEPKTHEPAIYQAWIASGGFAPRDAQAAHASGSGSKGTFTVMIPPPNVTGVLHMGHALNNTIQDIVVRFRRMDGYETLWVPGTDHAGIATQAVVEKKLFQEKKLKREDMGREAFLKEVWAWKEKYGNSILEQLRGLGSSCDWSRTKFTLDEDMSTAVRDAFVRLWEKGLIYRGARLVNWDCVLTTAVSDDEIEYVARKGKLWQLRYPLDGKPGEFITVATTRPETMLGDTGVAVNPADERYRHLIGSFAVLPFLGRKIPIVGDETVESGFGTGAVKITPGHDPADYERGARFKLPIVMIMEKDGRMSAEAGPFAGLSREKARDAVVKELDALGLLGEVVDHEHNVALSDRSKSVIEPMVSEQWFVKMQPLAVPAIEAVKSGRLRFTPERWTKVYLDWLTHVQDWCISRQLWWGHRIPVWYDEDGVPVASRTDLALGSPHPLTKKPIVRQDEDVLDTWASSWLWPFATLGWPAKSEDLARFYPTQFLSTAREIIYLWVARMVMAGYEFMDHLPMEKRCPFSVVNIHATVLDAQGRRMSKSLGNGIDPLELIEKYGADAVRLCLVLLTKEGQDTRLAPDRIEQGFRFGNKVWNAARFVLANLDGERAQISSATVTRLEDRWILSRLERTRALVTKAFEEYRFNDAAVELYRFVWNDFCDWYVELAKPRFAPGDPTGPAARGTLVRVLGDMLALLHPVMPYLTEALWSALHEAQGKTPPAMLMNSAWPTGAGLAVDAAAEADMAVIQDLVKAVRNVRALCMLGERQPLTAFIAAPRDGERRVLEQHAATARALAFLERFELSAKVERPAASACAVAGGIEAFVVLGASTDMAKLKDALQKRLDKVEKGVNGAKAKLANENFIARADPEVVAEERGRLAELELEAELVRRNLTGL
ncbi:MAG: valine--tRNA ligase [Planctomycetes bacterium]|nr:valine--tRNA ligase [Planctomycetota bacterium]